MQVVTVGVNLPDNKDENDDDYHDEEAEQHRGHDVQAAGSGAVVSRALQVPQRLPVSGLSSERS